MGIAFSSPHVAQRAGRNPNVCSFWNVAVPHAHETDTDTGGPSICRCIGKLSADLVFGWPC